MIESSNLTTVGELPEEGRKLYTVPDSYDFITSNSQCAPKIRDQQQCGSCYAFVAAEMLFSKICMASNGAKKVELSPQDMLSCSLLTSACEGGSPLETFNFLEIYGLVPDSSFPFASQTGANVTCPWDTMKAATKYYCKRGSTVSFETEEMLKKEIMNTGPLFTVMEAYNDLTTYTGTENDGVYKTTASLTDEKTGHAVLIVGN